MWVHTFTIHNSPYDRLRQKKKYIYIYIYINFCVPSTFIIWEVETSRIVYNHNPDPDSTSVQHKMNSFFSYFGPPIFEPKVITKNKSVECFLSQAQKIIKIWKFTIQKSKKRKRKSEIPFSEQRDDSLWRHSACECFFFFSNSGVDLLIFSLFLWFRWVCSCHD